MSTIQLLLGCLLFHIHVNSAQWPWAPNWGSVDCDSAITGRFLSGNAYVNVFRAYTLNASYPTSIPRDVIIKTCTEDKPSNVYNAPASVSIHNALLNRYAPYVTTYVDSVDYCPSNEQGRIYTFNNLPEGEYQIGFYQSSSSGGPFSVYIECSNPPTPPPSEPMYYNVSFPYTSEWNTTGSKDISCGLSVTDLFPAGNTDYYKFEIVSFATKIQFSTCGSLVSTSLDGYWYPANSLYWEQLSSGFGFCKTIEYTMDDNIYQVSPGIYYVVINSFSAGEYVLSMDCWSDDTVATATNYNLYSPSPITPTTASPTTAIPTYSLLPTSTPTEQAYLSLGVSKNSMDYLGDISCGIYHQGTLQADRLNYYTFEVISSDVQFWSFDTCLDDQTKFFHCIRVYKYDTNIFNEWQLYSQQCETSVYCVALTEVGTLGQGKYIVVINGADSTQYGDYFLRMGCDFVHNYAVKPVNSTNAPTPAPTGIFELPYNSIKGDIGCDVTLEGEINQYGGDFHYFEITGNEIDWVEFDTCDYTQFSNYLYVYNYFNYTGHESWQYVRSNSIGFHFKYNDNCNTFRMNDLTPGPYYVYIEGYNYYFDHGKYTIHMTCSDTDSVMPATNYIQYQPNNTASDPDTDTSYLMPSIYDWYLSGGDIDECELIGSVESTYEVCNYLEVEIKQYQNTNITWDALIDACPQLEYAGCYTSNQQIPINQLIWSTNSCFECPRCPCFDFTMPETYRFYITPYYNIFRTDEDLINKQCYYCQCEIWPNANQYAWDCGNYDTVSGRPAADGTYYCPNTGSPTKSPTISLMPTPDYTSYPTTKSPTALPAINAPANNGSLSCVFGNTFDGLFDASPVSDGTHCIYRNTEVISISNDPKVCVNEEIDSYHPSLWYYDRNDLPICMALGGNGCYYDEYDITVKQYDCVLDKYVKDTYTLQSIYFCCDDGDNCNNQSISYGQSESITYLNTLNETVNIQCEQSSILGDYYKTYFEGQYSEYNIDHKFKRSLLCDVQYTEPDSMCDTLDDIWYFHSQSDCDMINWFENTVDVEYSSYFKYNFNLDFMSLSEDLSSWSNWLSCDPSNYWNCPTQPSLPTTTSDNSYNYYNWYNQSKWSWKTDENVIPGECAVQACYSSNGAYSTSSNNYAGCEWERICIESQQQFDLEMYELELLCPRLKYISMEDRIKLLDSDTCGICSRWECDNSAAAKNFTYYETFALQFDYTPVRVSCYECECEEWFDSNTQGNVYAWNCYNKYTLTDPLIFDNYKCEDTLPTEMPTNEPTLNTTAIPTTMPTEWPTSAKCTNQFGEYIYAGDYYWDSDANCTTFCFCDTDGVSHCQTGWQNIMEDDILYYAFIDECGYYMTECYERDSTGNNYNRLFKYYDPATYCVIGFISTSTVQCPRCSCDTSFDNHLTDTTWHTTEFSSVEYDDTANVTVVTNCAECYCQSIVNNVFLGNISFVDPSQCNYYDCFRCYSNYQSSEYVADAGFDSCDYNTYDSTGCEFSRAQINTDTNEICVSADDAYEGSWGCADDWMCDSFGGTGCYTAIFGYDVYQFDCINDEWVTETYEMDYMYSCCNDRWNCNNHTIDYYVHMDEQSQCSQSDALKEYIKFTSQCPYSTRNLYDITDNTEFIRAAFCGDSLDYYKYENDETSLCNLLETYWQFSTFCSCNYIRIVSHNLNQQQVLNRNKIKTSLQQDFESSYATIKQYLNIYNEAWNCNLIFECDINAPFPTSTPTNAPTDITNNPTSILTDSPTDVPTDTTNNPTTTPTRLPSMEPTYPTVLVTDVVTASPTEKEPDGETDDATQQTSRFFYYYQAFCFFFFFCVIY